MDGGGLMAIWYSKLKEKEVISLSGGNRIGYVSDLVIDQNCGKICEIIITESGFGFAEKKNRRIEWCRIRCIGDDAILVDVPIDCCCETEKRKDKKRGLLF